MVGDYGKASIIYSVAFYILFKGVIYPSHSRRFHDEIYCLWCE